MEKKGNIRNTRVRRMLDHDTFKHRLLPSCWGSKLEAGLLHLPYALLSSSGNLFNQPPWRVHLIHDNFYQNDVTRLHHLLFGKDVIQLIFGLCTEEGSADLFFAHPKQSQGLRIIPGRDVVVLLLCTVNDTLDRVACIVDKQNHWTCAFGNHSPDLLSGELQTAITCDQNSAASGLAIGDRQLFKCELAAQSSRCGISDGTIISLSDPAVTC